ncbi:hypothetical protein [Streptomyces sp. NPDC059862]|uniref:hypothetical protein n=1 Tax=unclassified Streptomyces TaxID=2593676 RepID=UPI00362DDD9B
MLTFALALKDKGVPVPDIAKKLTIKTGKNAGKSTSVASLYRAFAEVRRTLPGNPACLLGKRTVSANTRVVSTNDNRPTIRDWLDNAAGANIADILAHGHCGKQLLEHYAVEVRDDINAAFGEVKPPALAPTSTPWPAPTRS